MRLVLEFRARGLEALEGSLNVRNLKIQNRAGMIELGLLWLVQHQTHATTIEKAKLARAEELRQSEYIAIEFRGAIDVVGVDGDLTDAGEGRVLGMFMAKRPLGKNMLA